MRINWRCILGIFFLLKVDSCQRIPRIKRIYKINKNIKIIEGNKYMEKLKEYDLNAQEYIINMGSFMYDKSRKYFEKEFTEETVLEKWSSEHETQKVIEEKKKLEYKLREKENDIIEKTKQITEMRDEVYKARDEEREKAEKNLEYFKRKELLMINNRKEEIREALDISEKNLKERILDLEKKCKEYNEMYVVASKGKKYETDIFKCLIEYNDEKLNSLWEISHVGNVPMKTDFLFKNKLNGKTILLDTKNNNPNSGVQKVGLDKFKRDVERLENNAIGGILLANSCIYTKSNYEVNREGDKYLIYIGCFEMNNIPLIFNTLNMIMEYNKCGEEIKTTDNLREIIKEMYVYEKEKKEKINKEGITIDQRIRYLTLEYNNLFKRDIELDCNNKKEIKEIYFEEVESGRTIIGEKSKNFVQYEEDGNKFIKYFKTKVEASRFQKKLTKGTNDNRKEKKVDKNIEIEVATDEGS
jgi:hypothetical protein|uniref:Uncharacterized protein n=1 Tax=viral metagenome TaxID=1070528 RepID=A0A6C0CJU3_9ZZZZ